MITEEEKKRVEAIYRRRREEELRAKARSHEADMHAVWVLCLVLANLEALGSIIYIVLTKYVL